jgi:hypothetical protein
MEGYSAITKYVQPAKTAQGRVPVKQIQLTKGKFALVDDEDFEFLSKWRWYYGAVGKNGKGYAIRKSVYSDGIRHTYFMHRLILLSRWDEYSDHINRNELDNRRCNLRVATLSQNQHNQSLHKNNTSGYKGLVWIERIKRWQVYLSFNRERIYLGAYICKEDAARAYDKAATKYYGAFATLNLPRGVDNAPK